ncbi:hypothetical protein ACP70R_037988 [Stipagrostis hirtigluma subsp. patula]
MKSYSSNISVPRRCKGEQFGLIDITTATARAPALMGKTHDPAFKWKISGFSALLERGAISAISGPFRSCGYECIPGSDSSV